MKCSSTLLLFIAGLFLLSGASRAQDERYFRDLLSGDFLREQSPEREAPRYRAFAPLYDLDLTGDNRFERLMFEMRDGLDWISILDYQKNALFRYDLGPTAAGSRVYRIRKIDVNNQVKALILYYYEGANTYLGIHANARAHILTYNPEDLKNSLKAFKGPAFWEEFHDGRDHYRRRRYDLEFSDLNNNGTKEMMLKLDNITRIYQFQENGEWKLL